MRLVAASAVLALVIGACDTAAPATGRIDLAATIEAAEPGGRVDLPAGIYEGPLVIDKPLTLVGETGTVITSPFGAPVIYILDVDGVELSNLIIEGGDSGVSVRRSTGVVLDRLTILGARWHGIFAHDAEITVRDCHVAGLTEQLAQGVEIINSDGRRPSLVEGCLIEGPVYEGVVSHVSHVTFRNNEVRGSTERGVVVTEMSAGRIEGNRVFDAIGNAYYCGDMSICSVVDNLAQHVSSAGVGFLSTDGHGLVVHFHSRAFVEDLRVGDIEGDGLLVMLESELSPVSLYP